MTRRLIVNADDFGQTAAINRGVVRAYDEGVVTSASLMVRWPAAREAAGASLLRPRLSVGLHVDFGEWRYEHGAWREIYVVTPLRDARLLRDELGRQLERFRRLLGRDPTHLDSHQHVHREEPAASVLAEAADRLRVPLRHHGAAIGYCGSFYGQTEKGEPVPDALTVDALTAILRTVPKGVTELACHPAANGAVGGGYAEERVRELETLCDPRVADVLAAERIELCSFADVANPRAASQSIIVAK